MNAVLQVGNYLYGGTYLGFAGGTIYQVDLNGNNYSILHVFTNTNGDGAGVSSDLVTDGTYLYGVSEGGSYQGTQARGIIFRLGLPGTIAAGSYSVLYTFAQQNANLGQDPNSIIIGKDGKFYGTTWDGGGYGCGVVFCFDGINYTVLHNFRGVSPHDGYSPTNNLVQSKNDGFLYGITGYGGQCNEGILYRLDTSGNNFSILHSFGNGYNGTPNPNVTPTNVDGAYPVGITEIGSLIYGATMHGGASVLLGPNPPEEDLYGTCMVFSTPESPANDTAIHNFQLSPDALNPDDAVILARDGMLYGATWQGGTASPGTIYRVGKDGSNYGIVHSFDDSKSEGYTPLSNIIQGSDSSLYGTNNQGGKYKYGTLYKVSTGGGTTILHHFGDPSVAGPPSGGTTGHLISLTVAPASARGGQICKCTVTVDTPAPAGGDIVSISGNANYVLAPSAVIIPYNSTQASFSVTARAVAQVVNTAITASFNGTTATGALTINPPKFIAMRLVPTTVTGGATARVTAYLDSPAPTGDWSSILIAPFQPSPVCRPGQRLPVGRLPPSSALPPFRLPHSPALSSV